MFFESLKNVDNMCAYDQEGNLLWTDKEYEDVVPKTVKDMIDLAENPRNIFTKKFFSDNKLFTIRLVFVNDNGNHGYIGKVIPYNQSLSQVFPEINAITVNLVTSYREHICNIVNIAKALTASLESVELYEEINAVRLQVQNCYHLLRQSGNMEQVNRYVSGNYNPECLDLPKTIEVMMNTVKMTVPSRKITFKSYIESLPVYVDEKALFYAFINIISNALCYSPEDEKISVIIKKVGKNAVITVKDHGFGMSAEEQAGIFDFGYTNKKINRTAKLGVGLYLSKLFTLACNGAIMVSSKENEGTTVTLKIPEVSGGETLDLNSIMRKYYTGLFSPVGIALCDVSDCKLYDLM